MIEQQEFIEQISTLEDCVQGLKETYDELLSLHSESQELQALNQENEIWDKFLLVADKIIRFDFGVLYFCRDKKWIPSVSKEKIPSHYLKPIEDSFEDGTVDWAVDTQRVFSFFPDEEDFSQTAVIVPMMNPLIQEPIAIGFFFVPREMNQRDQELLQFWSSQGAVSIENSRLYAGIKKHNQALAKINEFIENILKSIDDGIVTVDKQGKITHFSRQAEKILGISHYLAKGNHFSRVFKGNLRNIVYKVLEQLNQNRKVHQKEQEIQLREDKSLWIGVTGLQLTDAEMHQEGKMLVFRDLSEKREIIELKKINQMKDEFVSNVSHELRTPLTSIRAYSEILLGNIEDGYEDPDASKEFLGIIKEESERLSRLISDLLDVAKLESGKMTIDCKLLNLKDVVVNSLNVIRSFSEANNQELVMDFDTLKEYPVFGDKDRLQQVMMNILNNSVKYSNKPGTISFFMEEKSEGVFVSIKDTGIGMTEEQVEKIFEKFYRVDSTLTYEISGTGLGLSIVKHIVERHQGKIWVESEPGRGTSFNIQFPKELKEEEELK